jgi:hypothetical protein
MSNASRKYTVAIVASVLTPPAAGVASQASPEFPSFEAFASAGTQTAFATDGGALFRNPAALSDAVASLTSYSFAGLTNARVFNSDRFVGYESLTPWAATGVVWKPEFAGGRWIFALGYYNPIAMEVDQRIELSAVSGPSKVLGDQAYMLARRFARRVGVSSSYGISSRLSLGTALTSLWYDVQNIGSFQTESTAPEYGVRTQGFITTRTKAQDFTFDCILGLRFDATPEISLGFAWELPLKVISSRNVSESEGLMYTEVGGQKPTVSKVEQTFQEQPLTLKGIPQQQRLGVAWKNDGRVVALDINRRSTFVSRDNDRDKYASVLDWSGTARFPLSAVAALQFGIRTNFNAHEEGKSVDAGGGLDLRGGGTARFGDTEFGVGVAYVRFAEKSVTDVFIPEKGRAIQLIAGVNSYFK